jgi:flagellar assembly factor FliW
MRRPSSEDGSGDTAASRGGDPLPGSGAARTIAFPQGLPGFPYATCFSLRPLANDADGLLVMQSADDPDLRFLVVPYREDRLPLRRADVDTACASLGVPNEHAAVLLVVTRRPDDGGGARELYVNFRAPVVLDTKRRTAVQHVLASADYPFRHPLALAA